MDFISKYKVVIEEGIIDFTESAKLLVSSL